MEFLFFLVFQTTHVYVFVHIYMYTHTCKYIFIFSVLSVYSMLQNIHLNIFKGISPLLELMVIEKVAKETFLLYPFFLLFLVGKALVCSFGELIDIWRAHLQQPMSYSGLLYFSYLADEEE